MAHQITFSNPWVLRVDGARRPMAGYVAFIIAIGAILASMFGGPALYGLFSAGALAPALDRALQYFCIEGPLYIVALLGLAYEVRARVRGEVNPVLSTLIGGLVGASGFAMAVGLAAALGAVGPGRAPAPLDHRLEGMAIGAALIAFQVMGEELFFRGWLQPVLATRWGPGVGLGAASVLFALAHTFGRPIGAVAFVNDALAGLLFGLIALRSGGLIGPFAAHFAWNWTEQSLVGLTPNPGVDPLGSLFDLDLVGPKLLSGGADELNGSVCAMVALVIVAGLTLLGGPRRGSKPPG